MQSFSRCETVWKGKFLKILVRLFQNRSKVLRGLLGNSAKSFWCTLMKNVMGMKALYPETCLISSTFVNTFFSSCQRHVNLKSTCHTGNVFVIKNSCKSWMKHLTQFVERWKIYSVTMRGGIAKSRQTLESYHLNYGCEASCCGWLALLEGFKMKCKDFVNLYCTV